MKSEVKQAVAAAGIIWGAFKSAAAPLVRAAAGLALVFTVLLAGRDSGQGSQVAALSGLVTLGVAFGLVLRSGNRG